MPAESEQKWYATTVTEVVYPADRSREPYPIERLVLVLAEDENVARQESALIEATFHEATPAEFERWEELAMRDLTYTELVRLERLVRAEAVGMVSKRLREQQLGMTGSRVDRNLGKVIRLALLRSKLSLMAEDMVGDDDGQVAA